MGKKHGIEVEEPRAFCHINAPLRREYFGTEDVYYGHDKILQPLEQSDRQTKLDIADWWTQIKQFVLCIWTPQGILAKSNFFLSFFPCEVVHVMAEMQTGVSMSSTYIEFGPLSNVLAMHRYVHSLTWVRVAGFAPHRPTSGRYFPHRRLAPGWLGWVGLGRIVLLIWDGLTRI